MLPAGFSAGAIQAAAAPSSLAKGPAAGGVGGSTAGVAGGSGSIS